MELRRALLLFAIVLGLAAVATSLSSPGQSRDRSPTPPPAPVVRPAPTAHRPLVVRFDADTAPATHRIQAGRPATVVVRASQPGTVELEGLGLTAAVEPLTPASFDVLASRPGRHELRLTAADGVRSRLAGLLVVRRPR